MIMKCRVGGSESLDWGQRVVMLVQVYETRYDSRTEQDLETDQHWQSGTHVHYYHMEQSYVLARPWLITP